MSYIPSPKLIVVNFSRFPGFIRSFKVFYSDGSCLNYPCNPIGSDLRNYFSNSCIVATPRYYGDVAYTPVFKFLSNYPCLTFKVEDIIPYDKKYDITISGDTDSGDNNILQDKGVVAETSMFLNSLYLDNIFMYNQIIF